MSIIDVMNGIRVNGSAEYQTYIPLATRTNIATIANPILTYSVVQNEFLNAMINKVAMTIIRKKLLTNPLAALKKGEMSLGQDIEELHVNRAKGKTFDSTGADLLSRETPDVAVMYHRLTRKDMYKVTVSREQLTSAFTAWEGVETLLNYIVSTMYDGDSDDEFILMKSLMSDAVINDEVVTSKMPFLRDASGAVVQASANSLVEGFKNASSYMSFAGSNFNKYHIVNAGATPRRLKTEIDEQVIVLRADIANTIDVNVLASAFNMSKADFLANRVIVDNFGSATNVMAFLCDKDFFQVYDKLRTTEEFRNPEGLYWNYFYHVWQVVSYSLLVNAIAFVTEPLALTITPTITSSSTAVAGVTEKGASVEVYVNNVLAGTKIANASTGAYSVSISARTAGTVIKVVTSIFGETATKSVTIAS